MMGGVDLHAPNPVHDDLGLHPEARWDRRNIGEANPGVSTPLSASWSRRTSQSSQLRMFRLLGAIGDDELGGRDGLSSPYAGRLAAYVYGRRAIDAATVLGILGRLPGVDAGALEELIFGERSGVEVARLRAARRVAAVARTIRAVLRLPAWIDRRAPATLQWWQATALAAHTADWSRARALLDDAEERWRADVALHSATAVFHTAFVDRITAMAKGHLEPSAALHLVSGIDDMAETGMLRSLWDVSQGISDLHRFLAVYGYYAPDEGELATPSWRMDPSGLEPTLERYRTSPNDGPGLRTDTTRRAFDIARSSLRPRLSLLHRLVFDRVLAGSRRYARTRERSKAMMLQCTDATRAVVHRLGELLAAAGVLEQAADVYWLTIEELPEAKAGSDVRERIQERRQRHEAYFELTVPSHFTAADLVDPVAANGVATDSESPVSGLGVSPGRLTGRAVVMRTPENLDLQPDDVLVCESTDPGWAAMLSMVGGLVMDMGSALSHGAIVARELGIPCVAGTGDGTRRLRTGQWVRIDGTTGEVEVVAAPRAAQ